MSLKEKLGLLSATILTVGFGAAAPANAQTAPPAPAAPAAASGQEEAIVVTGSRIRRDPASAPAPLIQVTQDDLIRSGQPSVVDYLSDIPALANSQVPEDTTGSLLNNGGLSLLNLRNLGSVRTLVLVDGRRHVGAPQGDLRVDVNTIPRLLIDDIEIVTGGESALYGADAVSGVVNFILKKDFDGIVVDGSLAEINQDGQMGRRLSALVGHNFFDDRVNVYGTAEYERQDEVTDADMDWRRDSWALLNYDTDNPATPSDGQFDNVLIKNARTLTLGPRGGMVLLAGQVIPSPATDPDVPGLGGASASFSPLATCGAPPVNAFGTQSISGQTNCFAVAPELNKMYVFGPTGTARFANFGTFQDQNGLSRPTNVGGDGLNSGDDFSQMTRTPRFQAGRYQAGLNWDITNDITAYIEGKFIHEEAFLQSQPTFFQGGIAAPPSPTSTALIIGTTNFNVGTDNPFLDPAVRTAILTNTRFTCGSVAACAVPLALTADPRATFNLFGPQRTQFNVRETKRYVAGFRSDVDHLLFLSNAHWELGYTFGETDNDNQENAVDSIRFAYSSDAVTDTAGIVNGHPGETVCRVRLAQATLSGSNPDQLNGGNYLPTDPNFADISGCVPQSLFGVDMRNPGYNPGAEHYYDASIHVVQKNLQQDLMGYISGDLWNFWGAGPIGLAVGYEWRREKTQGQGRSHDSLGPAASVGGPPALRLLFLNTGPDFAPHSYNVTEYFGEVSVPLIHDSWLGESAEADFAYRHSDFSTVGSVESRSFLINWRPVHELLLRATYGESTRVPTLSEEFAPATQTFANGFVDPCDAIQIANATTANPTLGAQRQANCILAGIPAGTSLIYGAGIPGFNQGNPFLTPETSRSYTWSIVYTPNWLRNSSFVADFYDIHLSQAIAAISVQTAANLCVTTGAGLNPAACSTFVRNGGTHFVTTFIQGSINFAGSTATGIDFTARYHLDLQDSFNLNWGSLDWGLRGNYLIKRDDFTSTTNPGFETPIDSTLENPRVRFLLTTTYSPTSNLRFIWDWDWQASQEIIDNRTLIADPDNRDPRFANTGDFSQHDFTLRWDATDNFNLRVGVVNAFDAEPARWLGSQSGNDNFDLFGRRFFIGAQFKH